MALLQDIMNAEKWNPGIKKDSNANDEKEITITKVDGDNISIEGSSQNTTKHKELNSLIMEQHPGALQHDTSTVENIKGLQSSSRQVSVKSASITDTAEMNFTQPKPSSVSAFKTKKRVRKNGKLWILLMAGLLISIVSGAGMALWLSGSDSNTDNSLQANYVENSDMVLSGDDEDYITDDGGIAMGNESDFPDEDLYAVMDGDNEHIIEEGELYKGSESGILDEDLYAVMDENDMELNDMEYAEDDLSDIALEDSSFNEEIAVASVHGNKPGTLEENGEITMKEESPSDDKIAAAISSLKENRDKEIIIEKEVQEKPVTPKSTEKVKQPTVKKSSSVFAEKKQLTIVKPVSQETEVNKKISDTKKFTVNNGTQSISNSAQKTDKLANQKSSEAPITSTNKVLEPHKAEPVEVSVKEILQLAPVKLKESIKIPVKTASKQEKPFFSNTEVKAVPVDIPVVKEKEITASKQKKTAIGITGINTLPTGIASAKDHVVTASKQDKPYPGNTKIKSPQTGISSILKEMSVNYEDQFNSNTNNWPEYDISKASAVIAKGAYHIENRVRTGTHALVHPDGVPIDMDLMIDVSIGSVRSSGNNSYGFIFGAKDTSNNYAFLVRNGQFYSIEKMTGGKSTEMRGGQIDNIFISGDSQKSMKIVKRKNIIRFYIDGHLIDEIADIDYFGNKIGFLIRGKARMSVDRTRTQIRFQK